MILFVRIFQCGRYFPLSCVLILFIGCSLPSSDVPIAVLRSKCMTARRRDSICASVTGHESNYLRGADTYIQSYDHIIQFFIRQSQCSNNLVFTSSRKSDRTGTLRQLMPSLPAASQLVFESSRNRHSSAGIPVCRSTDS